MLKYLGILDIFKIKIFQLYLGKIILDYLGIILIKKIKCGEFQ